MLKPGVVMRSASSAAESSAVSRLTPEEGGEEADAMGMADEADATPRLQSCHLQRDRIDGNHNTSTAVARVRDTACRRKLVLGESGGALPGVWVCGSGSGS